MKDKFHLHGSAKMNVRSHEDSAGEFRCPGPNLKLLGFMNKEINWVGGRCGNILSTTFSRIDRLSALTDRIRKWLQAIYSCIALHSVKADFLTWQKSLAYSLRIFADNFSLLSLPQRVLAAWFKISTDLLFAASKCHVTIQNISGSLYKEEETAKKDD